MTAREINFITQKQTLTLEEIRLRQLIRRWTPIILGIFTIVLFLLLAISFFYKIQIENLDNSIAQEKQTISTRERDEGLYLLLKQKIGTLSQIITNRFDYTEVTNFFLGLQNDSVRIKEIEVSESGATRLIVNTPDPYSLDVFVRNLLDESQSRFNSVELISLDQDQNSQYLLVLNVQYSTSQ